MYKRRKSFRIAEHSLAAQPREFWPPGVLRSVCLCVSDPDASSVPCTMRVRYGCNALDVTA